VKAEADSFAVLLVGVTNDLSRARADWAKVARRGATHIFTRLNVARALRTSEHADVAAAYNAAVVSEGV
jgi:hypothetical protein